MSDQNVSETLVLEPLTVNNRRNYQEELDFVWSLKTDVLKIENDQKYNFTFIDLFAGIGGFRIPLEELGGKCIGFSEIDSTAIETYKKNFNTKGELYLGDITKINTVPNADIITGGVPCQSWSVAGKMKGFEDPRGALWFDTIKFVEKSKPKAFIFENVKGLADPRNRENLKLIVKSFEEIGYNVKYKVLNTFDFGLPQSRERIFLVGINKTINKDFKYPKNYPYLPELNSVINDSVLKYSQKIVNSSNIKNSFNVSYMVNKDNFFTMCDTRNGDSTIHSWDLIETSEKEKSICFALLKNRRKKIYGDKDGNPLSLNDLNKIIGEINQDDVESLINKKILLKKGDRYDFANSKNSSGINNIYRIYLPSSHVFSTLTKTGVRDYISEIDIPNDIVDKRTFFIENIYKKGLYRKISIREAARLQGFPDSYKLPSSYIKSLGLLGNALGVNIVRELAKNLIPLIH